MEWSRYKGNLHHGQYRWKITVSFTWRTKVDIFGPHDAPALDYTNQQPFPGSVMEGRGVWGFRAGSTVSIWRKVGLYGREKSQQELQLTKIFTDEKLK